MKIKIAIADDHPMIIKGLQNMLSAYPDIALTGTYPDGDALWKGLAEQVPDILLLDIQMPGKTGDQLTPSILKQYPELKIIILTNFDSALYVSNVLRHGVKGYLLKSTEEKVLIHAIETVYNGGEYVEPSMESKLRELSAVRKRTASLKSTLTPREKEILRMIVNGDTSPEIAERLFLSLHTVENYRISILIKLDVKNTAALVKKALQLGLVE
jgi:DNA-binding NarL/FixJ family response regulator